MSLLQKKHIVILRNFQKPGVMIKMMTKANSYSHHFVCYLAHGMMWMEARVLLPGAGLGALGTRA